MPYHLLYRSQVAKERLFAKLESSHDTNSMAPTAYARRRRFPKPSSTTSDHGANHLSSLSTEQLEALSDWIMGPEPFAEEHIEALKATVFGSPIETHSSSIQRRETDSNQIAPRSSPQVAQLTTSTSPSLPLLQVPPSKPSRLESFMGSHLISHVQAHPFFYIIASSIIFLIAFLSWEVHYINTHEPQMNRLDNWIRRLVKGTSRHRPQNQSTAPANASASALERGDSQQRRNFPSRLLEATSIRFWAYWTSFERAIQKCFPRDRQQERQERTIARGTPFDGDLAAPQPWRPLPTTSFLASTPLPSCAEKDPAAILFSSGHQTAAQPHVTHPAPRVAVRARKNLPPPDLVPEPAIEGQPKKESVLAQQAREVKSAKEEHGDGALLQRPRGEDDEGGLEEGSR